MGHQEIIEFLSPKLETRGFLESPLLNSRAARPLQQGCTSGRCEPAPASALLQPEIAFGALALELGLRYPGALSSVPSPPAAAAAAPAAASSRWSRAGNIHCSPPFFFFFTSAEVPADSLFVHPNRVQVRPPFFWASQGSGRSSARPPGPLPSPCQGDRFSGGPGQTPTLARLDPARVIFAFIVPCQFHFVIHEPFCLGRGGGGWLVPLSPSPLAVEAGKSALGCGGARGSSGRRLSALSFSPARDEGGTAVELELSEPLATSGWSLTLSPPLPRCAHTTARAHTHTHTHTHTHAATVAETQTEGEGRPRAGAALRNFARRSLIPAL